MLAPQALIRGIVARLLPSSNADSNNVDVATRLGRYGEVMTMPAVRKAHTLCDEGTYFVANNNQTAAAQTAAAGFSATTPFVLLQNGAGLGGPNLYLDYINLVVTVQGTAASGLTFTAATLVLDSTIRYSSAGTQITNIVSPNMALGSAKSNAQLYYGAITATAASPNARTVVGQRNIRPALSGTAANTVGDDIQFNFGGVEGSAAGQISVTASVANVIPIAMPPVVIGPQQSVLLYVYYAAATTPVAAQYLLDCGWWER